MRDSTSLAGDRLLSVRDAAAYLGVSESTVRRMVRAQRLPVQRVGVQLRFRKSDLEHIPSTAPANPSAFPPWAAPRVTQWTESLESMLPDAAETIVIVIDRRGAKTFAVLRPPGFRWGSNLWHSSALHGMSDDELRELLATKHVVIFDELVRRGREVRDLRTRLSRLGLAVRSICLVRKRSVFLDGDLADFRIEPIEDAEDAEFGEAVSFLSRLLDYAPPPLDQEHLVATGEPAVPLETDEVIRHLAEYGIAATVWNRQSPADATSVALTLDRPQFVDLEKLGLPDGIRARWDGPFKIRFYLLDGGARIAISFIVFPALAGSKALWRSLSAKTLRRYDGDGDGDDPTYETLVRTYVDICTDLSVDMIEQTAQSGLFEALGLVDVKPPPENELVAFFGPRRGREASRQVRRALAAAQPPLGPLERPEHRVPLVVDPARRLSTTVDARSAQRKVLETLPPKLDDRSASSMTYPELLEATRPLDETNVSTALDGVLDGIGAKPTVRRRMRGDEVELERAFVTGAEITAEQLYDAREIRRTYAVALLALDEWLRRREREDETEIHVTKLFANLIQDWGRDTLLLENDAYLHGYRTRVVATTERPGDKGPLLLDELRDAKLVQSVRRGNSWFFAVAPHVDVKTYADGAELDGHDRSEVQRLVRTYALIQDRCKVVRQREPDSPEVGLFSDPLVVLSSARNEAVAYECALFELHHWIERGRALFRILEGRHAGVPTEQLTTAVRTATRRFAQPARFLFGKIAAYQAVPRLREELKQLFEDEDVVEGPILLESITQEARLATDYTSSPHPIGVLDSAMGIARAFTSLTRQTLTVLGLELDTRNERDRHVVVDGKPVTKDFRHYALELARTLDDRAITARVSRLGSTVTRAAHTAGLERVALDELNAVFEQIVVLFKARIEHEHALLFDAHRRSVEREFPAIAEKLAAHPDLADGSVFVAVGDFYNFVSIVEQTAAWTGASDAALAVGLRTTFRAAIDDVARLHPQLQTHVASDTCVLAHADVDELLVAAAEVAKEMSREVRRFDNQIVALDFMRFGFDRFDDKPFKALVTAFYLGDGLHFPRGTFALTEDVVEALNELNRERCELTEMRTRDGRGIYVISELDAPEQGAA